MGKFAHLLLFFALTEPANAYVDPNSQGLLAQVLTPLLLMLGVVWATFRRKIVALKDKLLEYLSHLSGEKSGAGKD